MRILWAVWAMAASVLAMGSAAAYAENAQQNYKLPASKQCQECDIINSHLSGAILRHFDSTTATPDKTDLASKDRGGANFPTDRPVLQIHETGGFRAFSRSVDIIPQVTVWGDGRVVFAAPDGFIREAKLQLTTVTRLVNAAEMLFELQDRYQAVIGADFPEVFFTIETNRGRKTVSVYGFGLERSLPNKRNSATMEQLRVLWREVMAALPRQAPVMQTDEVTVRVSPPAEENASLVGDWPENLVGYLKGRQALEAIQRLGLGPARLYRFNKAVYQITAIPVLPILAAPSKNWPWGGLPRHPQATAYNAPMPPHPFAWGTGPYRFTGVEQSQVAAWYKNAMVEQGWRLAKEQGNQTQIWVRPTRFNDPLVILEFQARQFTIQVLRVENEIPSYPGSFVECRGDACSQLIKEAELDRVEIWMREYLSYFGWQEQKPNLFRKKFEQLRLEYQRRDRGIEVFAYREPAIAPPTGWAIPPRINQISLCEKTRGKPVEIAGRIIPLHSSLCLTQQEPDRLRVQVAYGLSYVDLNPKTGKVVGGSFHWREESNLFVHLEPLVGEKIPTTPR